jgi:Na+/H+ antiporter NhaC
MTDYGWLSILPPLLAIGLALVARQVVLALLLGLWFGAMVLTNWNPVTAVMLVADDLIVGSLADRSHAAIVLFSLGLGGMVGILSRSGASAGIVDALSGRVRNRRHGQLVTTLMGTAIFFDDYANSLLVGNTMRPLTDRLRISREKLAYLVDSTAAPIATIAVVSTWVGFEVGLIQDALDRLQTEGSGYLFFLQSLPYNFYPILTLAFTYMIAGSGRDLGPMRQAEIRAQTTGQLLRPGAQPATDTSDLAPVSRVTEAASPWLAALPIASVILITMIGLWWNGRAALLADGATDLGLRNILNAADSMSVLMWAAVGGTLVAGTLAFAARRLSLRGVVDAWMDGAKAMLIAMVILVLAWSLGDICQRLGTGPWLVEMSTGVLSPKLLPALTFLLASLVSFSTGTSWGTMAILIPIIYPLSVSLSAASGLDPAHAVNISLAATSAVLAGAVFGDHCSPISDTTILSSMASGSDHIDHVRTQLPYALIVGGVAVLVGYLPVGFGVSPWLLLPIGLLMLMLVLKLFARKIESESTEGR